MKKLIAISFALFLLPLAAQDEKKDSPAARLLEVTEFYKTPLGKKTLTSLPVIMGETMKFSSELAQKHVGSFQEVLGKVLERKATKEQKEGGE
jgi:hypothetical protein